MGLLWTCVNGCEKCQCTRLGRRLNGNLQEINIYIYIYAALHFCKSRGCTPPLIWTQCLNFPALSPQAWHVRRLASIGLSNPSPDTLAIKYTNHWWSVVRYRYIDTVVWCSLNMKRTQSNFPFHLWSFVLHVHWCLWDTLRISDTWHAHKLTCCNRRASDNQWGILTTIPNLSTSVHPLLLLAPLGADIRHQVSDWHSPWQKFPRRPMAARCSPRSFWDFQRLSRFRWIKTIQNLNVLKRWMMRSEITNRCKYRRCK